MSQFKNVIIVHFVFFLAAAQTVGNTIMDVASYKPIEYHHKRLFTLEFGTMKETYKIIKPKSFNYPYTGPQCFHVRDDKMVYLYEPVNSIVYMVDSLGKIVKFARTSDRFYDIWSNRTHVFAFDGLKLHVFTANDLVPDGTIDVGLPKDRKLIHGANFFYNGNLVIQNFNVKNLFNEFAYVFNIERNVLSNKIDAENLFLPIDNCSECNHDILKVFFFDKLGYGRYKGQSTTYISGEIVLPNSEDESEIVVMEKRSGKMYKLNSFKWNFVPAVVPFQFYNDMAFVFMELVKGTTLMPVGINFHKIVLQEPPKQ